MDTKLGNDLWQSLYSNTWKQLSAAQWKLELLEAQRIRYGEEDLMEKIGEVVMYLLQVKREWIIPEVLFNMIHTYHKFLPTRQAPISGTKNSMFNSNGRGSHMDTDAKKIDQGGTPSLGAPQNTGCRGQRTSTISSSDDEIMDR